MQPQSAEGDAADAAVLFLEPAQFGDQHPRAWRADDGWELFFWARNVTGTEYFDFLSAQPGESGLFVGQVGDPRTYGVTGAAIAGTTFGLSR